MTWCDSSLQQMGDCGIMALLVQWIFGMKVWTFQQNTFISLFCYNYQCVWSFCNRIRNVAMIILVTLPCKRSLLFSSGYDQCLKKWHSRTFPVPRCYEEWSSAIRCPHIQVALEANLRCLRQMLSQNLCKYVKHLASSWDTKLSAIRLERALNTAKNSAIKLARGQN